MHLDGYVSVIFKAVTLSVLDTKHPLTIYYLITWNENHALMVIQYCTCKLHMPLGCQSKTGNTDYDEQNLLY